MGCISSSTTQIINSLSSTPAYKHKFPNQAILLAIKTGDIRYLEAFHERNPNIDWNQISLAKQISVSDEYSVKPQNWSPILVAIYFNSLEVLEFFIERVKLNLALGL
jgi:hypothetical protein